jgi:hypothetical protein
MVDRTNDSLCAMSIRTGIVDEWRGRALSSRIGSHDCVITSEDSSRPLRLYQDILYADLNCLFDVQEYRE